METFCPILPVPREFTLLGGDVAGDTPVHVEHDNALPAEGYAIEISPDAIVIRHRDDAGLFYADETLGQFTRDGRIPCARIRDWPDYPWRGVMVDEGRHFFGKEAILRLLAQMATVKMNVLHWHLTEDQGWRIDIPGFPELVEWGSVRPSSPIRPSEFEPDGVPYGPFYYTADEIREIVAFAAERQIKVVPEIEIPGHARAFIAAHPEFNCQGHALDQRTPWVRYGISEDVLCIGNDEAIRYLERVLDKVLELFPSDVIHIGGDEAPTAHWKTCPLCQARMKAEGLKTERQLQTWVTQHFVDYLKERGRRVNGWDEIAEADLPKGAIVQSWRTDGWKSASGESELAAVVAAKAGLDVVNTPHDQTYLSLPPNLDETPIYRNPKADYVNRLLPLSKVYAFDPRAGVPDEYRAHILGSEACNWSEGTITPDELQRKMWPRTAAMAERLWSPPDRLDYAAFEKRLSNFLDRYGRNGAGLFAL